MLSTMNFFLPRKQYHSQSSLRPEIGSPGLNLQYMSSVIKRSYLSDYELLSNPSYCAKQVKDVALKSALLQGVLVMNEYNQHLLKQLEAENRGEKVEDFDFEPAVSEYLGKTFHAFVKNSLIVVTRKMYEAICVANVSIRTADRLTKDVYKSAVRKLARFSNVETCYRIFFTGVWSGLLRVAALFTVDCGYCLYEHFTSDEKQNERKMCQSKLSLPTVKWAIKWAGKRITFHSICMVWASAGYAVGVLVEPKYTATLCAALFETAAAAALTPILMQ